MAKRQQDNVFALIESMTKSEKRQFKLYVGRLGANEDSKFLNLFNFLDKSSGFDETAVLRNTKITKQQLANVKAHLYKQILVSLRLSPSQQNLRSQIREQLDFASILYHKGLYKQALKILNKAKGLALKHDEKNLAYEIVELEKIIESQYITRSMSARANELTVQAKALSQANVTTSKLSNLSLQLYGLYLKFGHAKNEEDAEEIKAYFNARMPKLELTQLGFHEKLWLYKSYVWYSFLLQDFLNCYKYALKWVTLFEQRPEMINLHPVFFVKGNNYLLESLSFIKNKEKFKEYLDKFETVTAKKSFNKDENVEALIFLHLNVSRINYHFIDGSFDTGLQLIPKIENELPQYADKIDEHHTMVFYYKFASMHFGAGNYEQCISYLQKIIINKSLSIRQDLQCFSRVLSLVAHYEAGLDDTLETQLRNTYKFLLKIDDFHEVQKEMLSFIRKLDGIYPHEIKQAFKELYAKLKPYENHPYERRAFLYLDIISWLESRIENRPVSEVIREKYLVQNAS